MHSELDGGACDAEAARLLPWFVTGRLSASDHERVSHHLGHCALCRADLEHEQLLRSTLKSEGAVEYAPQAGLNKVLARINELAREAPAEPGPASAGRAVRRIGTARWLTAAVVVQAIGLGVLGSVLFDHTRAEQALPRYETLSMPSPHAHGARLRAVFDPAMPLGELETLLAAHRLLIVDGPTDAGALTLATADAPPDAAALRSLLATLRADRRVLFAEPALEPGAARR
jgi:hypothetical protein